VVAQSFPYKFSEMGDLWLTDQLFRTEKGSESNSNQFKTVVLKNYRLDYIHKELNEGANCIAKQIEAEGSRASNATRNHEAWAFDVSQVEAKKREVDSNRDQSQGGLEYTECIGHAALFPCDSRKGRGPSNYTESPDPTLLAFLASRVKTNEWKRQSNRYDVGAVSTLGRIIRDNKKAKEKQERDLAVANTKLEKADEQEKEDTRLLKESSELLENMNGEKRDSQFALDKINEQTGEEEKNLTEKNDEYKSKVAELKQQNIDDLTCGCLYKYIDIATALLYMGITRCLAKALACTAYDSDDPNSKANLIAIPDIECWTGDHRFMAPAAVIGLCALYPTAMLTRPLFQALDEKLEFHFDYDYLFVFSQLQTFLLVASSFFPNTKEVLLLLCLFVDLVLLRFFMSSKGTDSQQNTNFFVSAHLSSNKKTVPTDTIEAYRVGSFLYGESARKPWDSEVIGKGGKIVEVRPRKPGDTKGEGSLVLELKRRSFLLPQTAENFVNDKLVRRRRMNPLIIDGPLSRIPGAGVAAVQHYEANPPAVLLANEVLVMANDPPLLMPDREETSMDALSIADQDNDVDARRETRTETAARNLKSEQTNLVNKSGDQDGDRQEQFAEGKQGSTEETICNGACTAQPINKIAIVAFGFSAW
jgi:hypothetical protein